MARFTAYVFVSPTPDTTAFHRTITTDTFEACADAARQCPGFSDADIYVDDERVDGFFVGAVI